MIRKLIFSLVLTLSLEGGNVFAADKTGGAGDQANKVVLGSPFWDSRTMENEPILFIQEQGQPVARGKLLFVPRSAPKLTHPDLKQEYVAGKDYIWKPGTSIIELTPGSPIPFKTSLQMVPPKGGPGTLHGVLFAEGHFFHDLQVQATYNHSDKWTWKPEAKKGVLARSLGKLKAKKPFKLVALGDSITQGYNASGYKKVSAPPFQPNYPQLVANTLQQRFSAPVTLVNLGVAGTTADWGNTQVPKVIAEKPDLVILAFGMNHTEPAKPFGDKMRAMLAAVQAGAPEADVVLVACMTGNPRFMPAERFTGYRDALRNLEGPNVAVADVATPWIELLKTKPFSDLSGNNINHPNDFGHRLYAQIICLLFR